MIIANFYFIRHYLSVCMILMLFTACDSNRVLRTEKRILLVSPADNTVAVNIGNWTTAIQETDENIIVDQVENPDSIQENNITRYSTIIFFHTRAQQFPTPQQALVERYVQSGGGLIFVNPELSNQFYWPWLAKISNIPKTVQNVNDKNLIDYKSDGQNQQHYDGGRIVFINTTDPATPVEALKGELSPALDFAIGDNTYDYSKAWTFSAPEERRFIKKVLDDQVNEPMDMTILPEGKVLFIEREGAIKLYDPKIQSTKLVDRFEVTTEGNYEDGMLGITKDPLFEYNNWIYIYYSPVDPVQKQNLSRFKFIGDSLIRSSEKVVLEVLVQRETCCHSGGAIVFDDEGNLYLSTGDNTSSKESDGYSPHDERPGRSPFDAQKSSSNTHDLRGKILRIKPTADGGYTIPDGNLFPKDGSKGRPEIYLMGLRNPFRFTVDPITNFVYWGDVGPDSGRDSKLGPQSYDEFNQAREPGFYGWPYFEADNKAYPKLDFATGELGPAWDPERPVNTSPNNTGDTILPPAQKAMIWYPYGRSKEFPMLGTGSRSAMGGPIFYTKYYDAKSKVRFPDYYNGKWFIYDWARSWIKVVTMDKNHDLVKIEPFLPETDFDKPIDIEFGPQGAMYILEYGANYFTDNDDARLSKIEYNADNTAPVAIARANKTVGAAPLKVAFSARQSFDYDPEDSLTYEWFFAGESTPTGKGIEADFTFENPGSYNTKLVVKDSKGESSTATLKIEVGNEMPVIDIDFAGNLSFYQGAKAIDYKVTVRDKEDGTTEDGQIPADKVGIHFNYLPHGKDLALLGPEQFSAPSKFIKGQNLIEGSDCRSCHSKDQKSIGPTYLAVAKRYADDQNAINYLGKKIIEGGNGNWGHSLMAAHPQHTLEETAEMVKYILSLSEEGGSHSGNLPLTGTIETGDHIARNEDQGVYVFSVSYRDLGNENTSALTATKSIVLYPTTRQAEDYDEISGARKERPHGGDLSYVRISPQGGHLVFHQLDLTQIRTLTFRLKSSITSGISVKIEGKEIGRATIKPVDGGDWRTLSTELLPTEGIYDIHFAFDKATQGQRGSVMLDWVKFGD
ncbi:PQQ-dependent sugar dehydrogenase [Fulvivirgaceae bacterium BMA12]|uniref:PQQ-dependent sugar dehydrogenase n=1 Tax=Agaribacillus aureus TaxID=3051825 RepID=A0ABT8LE70_9BACT|nr:PQQ-dependent sugar dehydrogenase [Fulvivirgaceae bacterium BMA12]